jgi:hypothetical protein
LETSTRTDRGFWIRWCFVTGIFYEELINSAISATSELFIFVKVSSFQDQLDLMPDSTEFFCFVADTRGYKAVDLHLSPELHTSEIISIEVLSEPFWVKNEILWPLFFVNLLF